MVRSSFVWQSQQGVDGLQLQLDDALACRRQGRAQCTMGARSRSVAGSRGPARGTAARLASPEVVSVEVVPVMGKPRYSPDSHVSCGAPKSYDPRVRAPPNTVDECV